MSAPAMLKMARMASPVGRLTIVVSDAGLRAVIWEDDHVRVRTAPADEAQPDDHPLLRRTVDQLGEYFAGTRQEFDLPLDLVGTEFQVLAWLALADVPYGETTTYSEQAARIGRPSAMRAIGAANGRNPVSIVLPCHRIIGADGSLTGFGGGLPAKRFLLDHERAHAPASAEHPQPLTLFPTGL